MDVTNLILEVTRRCDMTCDHCLRGDMQKKDIKHTTIDNLLIGNEIDYISSVTFTGGEPSLNTPAIRYFLDTCENNSIGIGGFYIATNGKTENEEFLKILMDLYLYCDDNECTQVQVSRDDYHYDQNEEWIDKLKILRFVDEKQNLEYRHVIAEGKGAWNSDGRKIKIYERHIVADDGHIENDELYINVNGDILTNCDLSYTRQNREKIGNINNDKLIELTE